MTYELTPLNDQTKTMLICLWSMRGWTRSKRLNTYIRHRRLGFSKCFFNVLTKAVSGCRKSMGGGSKKFNNV